MSGPPQLLDAFSVGCRSQALNPQSEDMLQRVDMSVPTHGSLGPLSYGVTFFVQYSFREILSVLL